MRRMLVGLVGGALPIVSLIALITVLATTLGFIDWSTPPGGGAGRSLEIAGVPLLPRAGAAAGRSAGAVVQSSRAAARRTSARRARLVAATVSARGAAPGGGAVPVTGQGGPAQGVGMPEQPGGAGGPGGGAGGGGTGGGSAGGTGGGDATPPDVAPTATTRAAPLAGVGTIVAVAAENTTQAVGMTVDRLTTGAGTALGPLHGPVATLGAGVDAIATQLGRAVGQIVRNVTGAQPRP